MKVTLLSMVTTLGGEANAKGREFEKAAEPVAVSSEHEPSDHLRQVLFKNTPLLLNITLSPRCHVHSRHSWTLWVGHIPRIGNACGSAPWAHPQEIARLPSWEATGIFGVTENAVSCCFSCCTFASCLFFSTNTGLIFFIAFFSLLASTAKIREGRVWEFGLLRPATQVHAPGHVLFVVDSKLVTQM